MEDFFKSLDQDVDFKRDRFRAVVGGKLAGFVMSLGKTRTAIAEKCGMKPSQLTRQLSGETNLTIDTIHRIAEAVDAEVELVFKLKAQNSVASMSEVVAEASFDRWNSLASGKQEKSLNFSDLIEAAGHLSTVGAYGSDDVAWVSSEFKPLKASKAANDYIFGLPASA